MISDRSIALGSLWIMGMISFVAALFKGDSTFLLTGSLFLIAFWFLLAIGDRT